MKSLLLALSVFLCLSQVQVACAATAAAPTTNPSHGKAVAAKSDTAGLNVSADRVVDLTHVLGPGMPDFHVEPEPFQYKLLYSFDKDGYASGMFTTAEHYGTHVDAPSHFAAGQPSIDQMPASKFVLPCVVIDVRAEAKSNPDYLLTLEKVKAFEAAGKIPADSAVLLLTGWADRWSNSASYRNADDKGVMHFPGFSGEAADYLMKERHVAGLGIDTLSLDNGASQQYPVHTHELPGGLFLIENLANLDKLPSRGALLICAPIPIKNGTGAPARILAILP